MKKITLLAFAFLGMISLNAQTTIFSDDFESYADFNVDDAGNWTFVDVDGFSTYGFSGITFPNSGYTGAFIVFNAAMTNPPLDPDDDPADGSNWVAHSGQKSMTSFAAIPSGGQGNNDWMISPQITLGTDSNTLTFWAKSASADYPNDYFNVAISTTDTNPSSFTNIATNELSSPAPEWHIFAYDLNAYAGQDVYIAINYVGVDQFGLQIDDFSVSGNLGIQESQIAGFEHFYNNATNMLGLKANEALSQISLYNILGQEVIFQKLSSNEEVINLSALNTGVYMAKVNVEGKLATFKIVKR